MVDPTLRLTRDQLAEFLPNSRAVRAFEQLLLTVGTTMPDELRAVGLEAGNGAANALLALGLLAKIEAHLKVLALAPAKLDSLKGAPGAPGLRGMDGEDGLDGEDGIGLVGPEGPQGPSGMTAHYPDYDEPEEFYVPPNPSSLYINDLYASKTITPSSTYGIVGTTLADSADAGSVGEVLTATATGVALTTATSANITSVTLTAGDWDVTASFNCTGAGGASITAITGALSSTSATLPSAPDRMASAGFTTTVTTPLGGAVPSKRVNVNASQTWYLVANCVFTVGTLTGAATITARRRR